MKKLLSALCVMVLSASVVFQADLIAAETAKDAVIETPDQALAELKAGNMRFLEKNFKNDNFMTQIKNTRDGQEPHTVILSCLDSRIPPEIVFDQGIGNIFVARVAGNVADLNIIGSMEFATKVIGSKLIVVMGHNHCGAVQGAMAKVELGNLTQLLEQIRPAVDAASDPKNEDAVGKQNVKEVMDNIVKNSQIIRDLIKENKVKIVGAYYDLETGTVTFL